LLVVNYVVRVEVFSHLVWQVLIEPLCLAVVSEEKRKHANARNDEDHQAHEVHICELEAHLHLRQSELLVGLCYAIGSVVSCDLFIGGRP